MVNLKDLLEIRNMQYRETPKEKHAKRMTMETPNFTDVMIPHNPPFENDSRETLGELKYLQTLETDKDLLIPTEFALFQNYPNPFNPSTQISFDIPNAEVVSLRIFNLLGQDVNTVFNKSMNPGRYTVEWNGQDMLNNEVSSGVYFYELRSKSFVSRRKMLLIR